MATGSAPKAPSERWRRLFSTELHPTNVIQDPRRLHSYQMKRLFLTVFGALLGSMGVGFARSHDGAWSPTWEFAVAIPGAIGLLVAIVFVIAPLPEIVRVIVGGAFTVLLFVVAVQTELLAALAMLAGGVVSIGFSAVVIRIKKVLEGAALGFRHAWAVALIAGATAVGSVVLAEPANAQVTEACTDDLVRLTVAGVEREFGGEAGDPLRVRVEGESVEFSVTGDTSFERGTLFVRIVDVALLPTGIYRTPVGAVVWAGEIDGGAIEGEPVVIRREGQTYQIEGGGQDADLGLVAGQVTYRATLSDGSRTCTIDAVVRIEADPATTVPGLIALAATALGGGLAMAAVASESVRILRRYPPRSIAVEAGPDTPTGHDQFLLRIQLEEKDLDEEQLMTGEIRLRDMAGLTVGVDIRRAGVDYEIPITITTDPEKVIGKLDPAGCIELLHRDMWIGVRRQDKKTLLVEILDEPYEGTQPYIVDVREGGPNVPGNEEPSGTSQEVPT